ncbi:MAG: YlbF family regulator [Eubacteriales bacterium]|nr:YlbF family regulator [Eubacteriales bacterium]
MERVLNQAEQLAEAILDSEEFIKMRLAEQAAMQDEEAAQLLDDYAQKRRNVEDLLSSNELDHVELKRVSEELTVAQNAMDGNLKIKTMREASNDFAGMMNQVNKIIKFVVTGENEEDDGCSGSCSSCGGSCGCGDSCGDGCSDGSGESCGCGNC